MTVESNRAALRKLSRKFPPPPEVGKTIARLRKDSDLSIAITATALVEAQLEILIVSKFEEKKRELLGQIFLNRGPLADFHSKILIATAFGLIGTPMANELHCMKTIRNAFAHAKVPISFEHELVKREVKAFRMLNVAHQLPNNEKFDKHSFLHVAHILLAVMSALTRPDSVKEIMEDFMSHLFDS